jgi:hypothetical protein
MQITSGTYPLASYGYAIFLPANSGNAYQIIGIYAVANNSGTYSYSATGVNSGQAIINDITDGFTDQVGLTFSSATQGSFSVATISPPGYYQSGYFSGAIVSAPGSLAGMSLYCTVSDGLYPFAAGGDFTIVFSASGNTYTVTGSASVANSSGTYTYSLANRSTGMLQITDSVTGTSTVFLGFSTTASGGYAVKASSGGGFQVGSFSVLDTIPPAVTITSPVAGQRWSNSVFTVAGTASDNVQVAQVYYRNNGGSWSVGTTTNNWATWSGLVTLAAGTNVVQAYAQDTSGNVSVTSAQSIVYVLTATAVIQITGVGTVSPNYNGQLLVLGQTYSITATAGAGFAFTNWTGSVTSSAASISFLMVSNLQLTANFVDVTAPTLTVLSPTSGQFFANPATTITGTASDNVQVAGVYYQLNTNPWKLATTANGFTNWSATALLIAGTNNLKVVPIDPAGNYGLTKSLNFTCAKAFSMTLSFGSPQPLNSNGLALALNTATGIVCGINFSTNLISWGLLTNITTTASSTIFRDPGATRANSRFYRAVIQQ